MMLLKTHPRLSHLVTYFIRKGLPLSNCRAVQVSDKYPLTFSVLSGSGTASLLSGGMRLEAMCRSVAGVVTLGDTPVLAFAGERPAMQLEWHGCAYPSPRTPML